MTPFEKETGCQVNVKFGNTSDEMVQLMRTGQYDGVSASGDATLRLIYAGDVAPVNTDLVPNYATISDFLKDKSWNSVDGQMYGIPHGWGANLLMYNLDVVRDAPNSWGAVFDGGDKYKGKVTAYDSPIYIADAALYLSKTKPELGIKDPYSLTTEQLDAATDLLKKQRENVGEYWSDYTKEVQAFESGTSVIGTTWQVIANTIGGDNKVQVNTVLPKEGATGWSDTWMISSKAAHPNCMYKWMDWITSPEVNAQVAEYFGEAPGPDEGVRAHHAEGFLRHLPRHRRRLRRPDPLLDNAAERSASTAAATTARPTTSGSTSGSRSRGNAGRRRTLARRAESADIGVGESPDRPCLPFDPADGLARAGLPGIACGAAGFGVLEHQHLHRSGGAQVHHDNFVRVFTDEVFRIATVRTVGVALLVTVICMVLAVPLALYMAKVASPRVRLLLVIAVTTPLWASYLVKAYAWRMLLSPEGPLSWATGYTPGYGLDGHRHHADLSVVAVHGHSGVRGIRPSARLAYRRQFRPRCVRLRRHCEWSWRRWCFRASQPGRSSRSRCRSATTSR